MGGGAELVETAAYARCSENRPGLVGTNSRYLCKRHYFDPHWEKKRASRR